MQGIFINFRRPKSKKEIKEAFATDPKSVELEATSVFGNDYGGPLVDAPDGMYFFVGPDPRTKRSFYGQVIKKGSDIKIK